MTDCEFPWLSARTAYRKGCRCPVCKRQRRADDIRWGRNRAEQCFEGGLAQSVIDQWAANVWRSMSDKEQRIVREVLD